MPNSNIALILSIASLVWLAVLTVMFLVQSRSLKRAFSGSAEKNIVKVLEDISDKIGVQRSDIEKINSEILKIIKVNEVNIQKIGLVKFNPFNELGGSHSFSVALLDGKLSGIIITGLHARDKTRLYLKSVNTGKSDIALSAEEEKALKIAAKK